MMNEEGHQHMPFMEVDSHFGEFELFEKSKRQHTVVAKRKCVVYVIDRSIFLGEILVETRLRIPFLKAMRNRLQNFDKSERECGREIRR